MKTIVLQSFRTRDVPSWISTCMASVRRWADGCGWEYEFMDDAFFLLAPEWARVRCENNLYAVTDICRLVWARKRLDDGYQRVVWADADVLVFAPQALVIAAGSGHGFARELFLRVDGHGRTAPKRGVNNALMAFEGGDPVLNAYLQSCYDCLRALPPGPVPRTALGPELLTRLAASRGLRTIEGVGMFSLALMQSIAQGGGPITREYLRLSTTPPVAANLCHFLRNAIRPDLRARFDQTYEAAVRRLAETGGAVLAARPGAL